MGMGIARGESLVYLLISIYLFKILRLFVSKARKMPQGQCDFYSPYVLSHPALHRLLRAPGVMVVGDCFLLTRVKLHVLRHLWELVFLGLSALLLTDCIAPWALRASFCS